MDNVQNCDSYTNIPTSETCRYHTLLYFNIYAIILEISFHSIHIIFQSTYCPYVIYSLRSASLSWHQAPIWDPWSDFITVRELRVSWCLARPLLHINFFPLTPLFTPPFPSNCRAKYPRPLFLHVYSLLWARVYSAVAQQWLPFHLFLNSCFQSFHYVNNLQTFYLSAMHPVALLFKYIPAIVTDNLYFFIAFCLFTTCFGPYGPSSGETNTSKLIHRISNRNKL
jgi:hypothetical protein